MKTPIRVAIGYDDSTIIASKVLEYSIRKNASSNVSIQFFDLRNKFEPGLLAGKTGFSFLRWAVPEFFNYEGKAIYLDADQLVFGDLLQLWESDQRHPNEAAAIWCAHQPRPMSSVMLIDCQKSKKQLPSVSEMKDYYTQPERGRERSRRYRQIMRLQLIKHPPQCIEASWNHLDTYVEGETQLLHFTDLSRQPWRNLHHPFGDLWYQYLSEALDQKHLSWKEIEEACATFIPYERRQMGRGLHPDVMNQLQSLSS